MTIDTDKIKKPKKKGLPGNLNKAEIGQLTSAGVSPKLISKIRTLTSTSKKNPHKKETMRDKVTSAVKKINKLKKGKLSGSPHGGKGMDGPYWNQMKHGGSVKKKKY